MYSGRFSWVFGHCKRPEISPMYYDKNNYHIWLMLLQIIWIVKTTMLLCFYYCAAAMTATATTPFSTSAITVGATTTTISALIMWPRCIVWTMTQAHWRQTGILWMNPLSHQILLAEPYQLQSSKNTMILPLGSHMDSDRCILIWNMPAITTRAIKMLQDLSSMLR